MFSSLCKKRRKKLWLDKVDWRDELLYTGVILLGIIFILNEIIWLSTVISTT